MLNTFSILSLIIAIPFLGMLFTLFAKESADNSTHNVFSVALFAVVANIVMILRIFMLMEVYKHGLQLVETYNWMQNPDINIVFGVDVLSLMLLLAIHIAFIIGFIGVRNNFEHQKSLMVWSLLFLSMITGFFVSFLRRCCCRCSCCSACLAMSKDKNTSIAFCFITWLARSSFLWPRFCFSTISTACWSCSN